MKSEKRFQVFGHVVMTIITLCAILPLLLLLISSFTDNDTKRNMGIGLSVCEAIIRAHGGKMEARHSIEGGLAVSFVLPTKEHMEETDDVE